MLNVSTIAITGYVLEELKSFSEWLESRKEWNPVLVLDS